MKSCPFRFHNRKCISVCGECKWEKMCVINAFLRHSKQYTEMHFGASTVRSGSLIWTWYEPPGELLPAPPTRQIYNGSRALRPVVAGEQIAQTGRKSCSLPRPRENTVIRMQKERTKARSCFLSRNGSICSLYGRDLRVVWYGGSRLWGHRVICLLPSLFGQRVCSSRL